MLRLIATTFLNCSTQMHWQPCAEFVLTHRRTKVLVPHHFVAASNALPDKAEQWPDLPDLPHTNWLGAQCLDVTHGL